MLCSEAASAVPVPDTITAVYTCTANVTSTAHKYFVCLLCDEAFSLELYAPITAADKGTVEEDISIGQAIVFCAV